MCPPSPPSERPPHHRLPSPDQGSTTTAVLTVDWHVRPVDEVTLVTVRVANTDSHPRRVRVDNALDAPVLPPRRNGVAARGWDEDGVERVVDGHGTLSVGYACRAPPSSPPIAVRDAPADGAVADPPVERALRSLGAHAPPRAVLVDDDDCCGSASTTVPVSTSNAGTPDAASADHTASDCSGDGRTGVIADRASPTDAVDAADDGTASPPLAVIAWFNAVEARLDTAALLSGDVHEATPVIASLGGGPGVETLAETLATEATALRAVADRATALATRAEATDVPDVGGRR